MSVLAHISPNKILGGAQEQVPSILSVKPLEQTQKPKASTYFPSWQVKQSCERGPLHVTQLESQG